MNRVHQNAKELTANSAGVISYRGAYHPKDMPSLYSEVSFLIIPTLYGEGVPRVILEASACGVPCIGYDWRGVRDAIEHGETGWLVRPGSEFELLSAVRDATELSYAEYMNKSRAARAKMEREFCETTVIESYRTQIAKLQTLPTKGSCCAAKIRTRSALGARLLFIQ